MGRLGLIGHDDDVEFGRDRQEAIHQPFFQIRLQRSRVHEIDPRQILDAGLGANQFRVGERLQRLGGQEQIALDPFPG